MNVTQKYDCIKALLYVNCEYWILWSHLIALFITLTLLIFMLYAWRISHRITILEQSYSSPSWLIISIRNISFYSPNCWFPHNANGHLSSRTMDIWRFSISFYFGRISFFFECLNHRAYWTQIQSKFKIQRDTIFVVASLKSSQKRKHSFNSR